MLIWCECRSQGNRAVPLNKKIHISNSNCGAQRPHSEQYILNNCVNARGFKHLGCWGWPAGCCRRAGSGWTGSGKKVLEGRAGAACRQSDWKNKELPDWKREKTQLSVTHQIRFKNNECSPLDGTQGYNCNTCWVPVWAGWDWSGTVGGCCIHLYSVCVRPLLCWSAPPSSTWPGGSETRPGSQNHSEGTII